MHETHDYPKGLVGRCWGIPESRQAASGVSSVLPEALGELGGATGVQGCGAATPARCIPAADIDGAGFVVREYGLDLGRTDLLVIWPSAETISHYVAECKVRYGSLEAAIDKGVEQTAAYMYHCDASEGHLVVFDRSPPGGGTRKCSIVASTRSHESKSTSGGCEPEHPRLGSAVESSSASGVTPATASQASRDPAVSAPRWLAEGRERKKSVIVPALGESYQVAVHRPTSSTPSFRQAGPLFRSRVPLADRTMQAASSKSAGHPERCRS